jgi:hypothetical protein
MSAQVIELAHRIVRAEMVHGAAEQKAKRAKRPITERRKRYEQWMTADAETDFWLKSLEHVRAVDWAQRRDVPAAMVLAKIERGEDFKLVGLYRVALMKQLLVPAYNMATLNWKKRNVNDGGLAYEMTVITQKPIEQQIVEDEAWLIANVRSDAKRKRETIAPCG